MDGRESDLERKRGRQRQTENDEKGGSESGNEKGKGAQMPMSMEGMKRIVRRYRFRFGISAIGTSTQVESGMGIKGGRRGVEWMTDDGRTMEERRVRAGIAIRTQMKIRYE